MKGATGATVTMEDSEPREIGSGFNPAGAPADGVPADLDRTDASIRCLTNALGELTRQKHKERTMHEALYALRHAVGASAAVVLVKDVESDYLSIRNHYNLPAKFADSYRRGVGTAVIGRLFYSERVATVGPDSAPEDYADLRMDGDYAFAQAVRIELDGRTAGILAVYWTEQPVVDFVLGELLSGLAHVCALAIMHEDFCDLVRKYQSMDSESGLLVYHVFHRKLEEELARSRRYDVPLAAAFMDLRNFKQITNTFGLDTGRTLFRDFVAHARTCLREPDVMCRFGSDEVMAYFPNTDADGVENLLLRLIESLRSMTFTDQHIKTSLNIGYTALAMGDQAQDMIWRTQKALHESRLRGLEIVRV